jgi:tRNA(Arg) A34 adenosine deaminase TadA
MKEIIGFPMFIASICLAIYANYVAEEKTEQRHFAKSHVERIRERVDEGDYLFLRKASAIGKKSKGDHGSDQPGTIVVRDGLIIGKGSANSTVLWDSASHPEMLAIREAMKHLDTTSLRGCVIYSSAEPCPLCLSLIYMIDLDRIIYVKSSDPSALEGLNEKVRNSLMKHPSERHEREVIVPSKVLE